MKANYTKWPAYLCRARFALAVLAGLGIGWAMSGSLGPAVSFALGGGITVALLARRKDC